MGETVLSFKPQNERAVQAKAHGCFRGDLHLFPAGKDLSEQSRACPCGCAYSRAAAAAKDCAHQRAKSGAARAILQSAFIFSHAPATVYVYIGAVHALLFAAHVHRKKIEGKLRAVDRAATGDVSDHESCACTTGNRDAAGTVRNILTDDSGK